ncbi:hypothetical protein BCR34DRAFT_353279 [Clohesyomyces aquaticus]|uniref:Uncharacterized protein n=1 Tax=Clohesyomyces aquaticus TaxID=1231657 RepID=A0A1Y1ZJI0_9PLEO|nr:hypothetical protein BCR34DRAFT_353279 [Clohesyomyces aquaticus]
MSKMFAFFSTYCACLVGIRYTYLSTTDHSLGDERRDKGSGVQSSPFQLTGTQYTCSHQRHSSPSLAHRTAHASRVVAEIVHPFGLAAAAPLIRIRPICLPLADPMPRFQLGRVL